MAASVANDAFWRASGSGGVNDIDWICRSNWYAGGFDIPGATTLDDALPVALPIIAADGMPADLWPLPDDDTGGLVGGEANGLFNEGLVGGRCLPSFDAA
jgi:hypothetical protein